MSYRLKHEMSVFWHEVTMVNIGAGGVRFRGEEELSPGTDLDMRMQLSGSGQPLEVSSRVVWSALLSPGAFETGVEFLDLQPEQQAAVYDIVAFFMKSTSPPGAPS